MFRLSEMFWVGSSGIHTWICIRKYKCVETQKMFSQQPLQIHTWNHSWEKPFACSVCRKRFSTSNYSVGIRSFMYTLHILWHTDVKPHACSDCSIILESTRWCNVNENRKCIFWHIQMSNSLHHDFYKKIQTLKTTLCQTTKHVLPLPQWI